MTKIKILFFVFSFALFAISCEDKDCPDGMHETTLNDGTEICVPD